MNKISNEYLDVSVNLKGAEIKKIKYGDLQLLHDGNPDYWNRSAPFLFPNIGAIKDKFTIFDGVKYPLTKHGFLRDVDFKLVNKTKDSLILNLVANDKTLALYPFKFKVSIKYQLEGPSIKTTITVLNQDNKIMPFNFGLHPAFKIPFIANTIFEDYKIIFNSAVNCHVPTVLLDSGLIDWHHFVNEFTNLKELPLNHEDYKFDAIIIDPMPQGEIKIEAPDGSTIIVDAPDFKTLGIWTPYPKKAPFICIEPWIGYADDPESNHEFKNKKDLIFLKPQESFTTSFRYSFNIKK